MRTDTFWTTGEELRLIDTLGEHHSGGRKLTARQALEGYIAGAKKRVNWDGMDRTKVLLHAHGRLNAL